MFIAFLSFTVTGEHLGIFALYIARKVGRGRRNWIIKWNMNAESVIQSGEVINL